MYPLRGSKILVLVQTVVYHIFHFAIYNKQSTKINEQNLTVVLPSPQSLRNTHHWVLRWAAFTAIAVGGGHSSTKLTASKPLQI
ncbi:hypothetical protein E2C01_010764 [Portunus trituberculatus]|uniref:Uncharacterized protein n=1 Tax=Portunus trituberculatus TaxID=210409 RepID=A0A5B7D9L8_PORTR|nr:hypothetical protein [Portunus trituberculatus]